MGNKTGTRKGINKYMLKNMCDGDMYPKPKKGREMLKVKVGDKVRVKTFSAGDRAAPRTGIVTYVHPKNLFASVEFTTEFGRKYTESFPNIKGKLADDNVSYIIKGD